MIPRSARLTELILVAMLVAFCAWEAYAMATKCDGDTFSEVIRRWDTASGNLIRWLWPGVTIGVWLHLWGPKW